MKIVSCSLAAIAVSACMSSAYAQQQGQVASATEAVEPVQTVTVTARRFHVTPQEFKDYEYTYVLSNSDVVRFSRRVGRFYVAIKGQPTVEIFPAAAEQFVTRDGARLVFADEGDKLTIDHYELLQAASEVQVAALPAAPK